MVELGTKHECEECGTKYYDLGNSEAICPNCEPSNDASDAADADVAEESGGTPKKAAKGKTSKKSTKKKAGAKKKTKKKTTKKKTKKK